MEQKSYNDTFGKGKEAAVRELSEEEVREEHNKLKGF